MDLQHNIEVDKIKMEIWSDRQNFLNQILELENKSEKDSKKDENLAQKDEEVNTDSKKWIRNKEIHAKSMKELNKLDRFDHIDDNTDDIVDDGHHRISESRRRTRDRKPGDYYDDYDNDDANMKSDLLRHDEIADRLERQLRE